MSEDFDRFLVRLAEDLQYIQIGIQEFTSTELYICDPMDQARAPIKEPIVPGRYPLYLVRKNWTHHSKVEATPHNARFEVWFSDAEPTQWEQIINQGNDVYDEFSAEFGSMSFLDNLLMDCLTPINEKGQLFNEYLCHQFYDNHKPRPYAEVKLDQNHHFFVVYSGKGNGMYYAYAGRDDARNLLRISVDFEL